MIAQNQAQRLLDRLAGLGIRIECRSDRLRLTPAANITTELLRQLKRHKAELMAILQNQTSPEKNAAPCGARCRVHWTDEPATDGRIRTRCGRCGRFIGYRRDGGK